MTKIFNAYAQRKGVAVGTLRFMLDGQRINDGDTPKMLELEDNDQIDVFLEQVGGMTEGGGDDAGNDQQQVTVRVKDSSGEEMFFKVKRETKMSKIFDAYANRKGVGQNSLRFMLDGVRIKPDETPKMLELEDNDQIDALLETVGGSKL